MPRAVALLPWWHLVDTGRKEPWGCDLSLIPHNLSVVSKPSFNFYSADVVTALFTEKLRLKTELPSRAAGPGPPCHHRRGWRVPWGVTQ